MINRKHDALDLLTLYAKGNSDNWNMFLTKCLKDSDINRLLATAYSLQAGMTDLERKKLTNVKIDLFFIRLQRSIENTVKKIWRLKNPNPLYDPNKSKNPLLVEKWKKQKQDFDKQLESMFKRSRF